MMPWKVLRGREVVAEYSTFAAALAYARDYAGYTVYYENDRGMGTAVWP